MYIVHRPKLGCRDGLRNIGKRLRRYRQVVIRGSCLQFRGFETQMSCCLPDSSTAERTRRTSSHVAACTGRQHGRWMCGLHLVHGRLARSTCTLVYVARRAWASVRPLMHSAVRRSLARTTRPSGRCPMPSMALDPGVSLRCCEGRFVTVRCNLL